MQLDQTLIAVHERGLLETLDLSLHVVRRYAWPLIVTFALGAVPLAILNHLLIGWMMAVEYRETYFYLEESRAIARYLWDMSVLIAIEAPLASIFATKFLGDAVFVERPPLRIVVKAVAKLALRVGWCQSIVRGILGAWVLMFLLERNGEFQPGIEVFMLGLLLMYCCSVRAMRPFINEIILLEQNPLFGRSEEMITVGKRSNHLHGPSGGDLFSRWLGSFGVSVLLTGTVFGTFLFCSGVFFNDWRPGPLMLQTAYPLSLWIVAGFITVVRFLSYLDLRIRHEGWETELLLRAEAARLMSRGA